MATRPSVPAQEIRWAEEPGGLQSTGPQRGGHDQVTECCRRPADSAQPCPPRPGPWRCEDAGSWGPLAAWYRGDARCQQMWGRAGPPLSGRRRWCAFWVNTVMPPLAETSADDACHFHLLSSSGERPFLSREPHIPRKQAAGEAGVVAGRTPATTGLLRPSSHFLDSSTRMA